MKADKLTIHGRTAARMAAIQALYQLDLESSISPELVIAQFITDRFLQKDELVRYIKPDVELFRTLVLGVHRSQELLDTAISNTLSNEWRIERLETILRAILRLGAFELLHTTTTPTAVIINEYVSLTKAFFDQKEPSFVNASLDKIAKGKLQD
jgi:N utilization substance protein B